MTLPTLQDLYDVTEATWPSASMSEKSGWVIKDGAGGGKRVCAAVQLTKSADIQLAEAEMLELGQDKLFQIRTGDNTLDKALALRGYELFDRVVLMVGKLTELEQTADGQMEERPNSSMKEIWEQGGIGPARLAVMDRAKCTKAYARIDDKAVAYAAIHNNICMAHAVEVSQDHRRKGLGRKIMHQIAGWADQRGADYMAVITVTENTAARTLYQNLGLQEIGNYHYRIKRG